MQQHTTALNRKTPGRQNRLAFGARPQTLGDAIDKQIRDLVLAQIARRKRLVVLPQPTGQRAVDRLMTEENKFTRNLKI